MIRTHFEHDYGEVEAIVSQQFADLRPKDRKYITDVAYAYGNTHRNSAAYGDFKRVVSCALPSNVRESELKPIYTRLFDYTTAGIKRDKAKVKNASHNHQDQRVQPRIRAGLILRTHSNATSLSRIRE